MWWWHIASADRDPIMGVWGGAAAGPGVEPLLRAQEANGPLKLKTFQLFDAQQKRQICPFSVFYNQFPGNGLDKLRHPRLVVYSVELVLLNKHHADLGWRSLSRLLPISESIKSSKRYRSLLPPSTTVKTHRISASLRNNLWESGWTCPPPDDYCRLCIIHHSEHY